MNLHQCVTEWWESPKNDLSTVFVLVYVPENGMIYIRYIIDIDIDHHSKGVRSSRSMSFVVHDSGQMSIAARPLAPKNRVLWRYQQHISKMCECVCVCVTLCF